MRKLLTAATAALTLIVVAVTPIMAEHNDDIEVARCPAHPCVDLKYDLLYRLSDGSIVATAWAPRDSGNYFMVHEGEAVLDITGHPEVGNLVGYGMEEYRVDLATGQVERTDPTPIPTNSLLIPVALGVMAASGGGLLLGGLRARRRR